MADLATKQQLASAAETMAKSFELVQRGVTTYIPVDWQTYSPIPPPQGERIWLPFTLSQKQQLANQQSRILFASDSELRNFDFMLRQLSQRHDAPVEVILVKTSEGLRALNAFGQLVEHDGSFTPNYVKPLLNEDPADKAEVFGVLVEWLGSEEEAHSLLNHLATCLAPGWSAVKYVILLGEGRNGKGVLLKMLSLLFGEENVSNVSRQMMAERNPTITELNDKLLNVIFDGEMAYIKDSAMEKTLIAGEPGVVRRLYESGTTIVQTTCLFVEALNLEPKARDKSTALQKRMARFHFPRVYPIDRAFYRRMTSEPMLGALLSLLIDHYVREDEVAEKLALTKGSLELQMEQVFLGNPVLQFLEHLSSTTPASISTLEAGNMSVDAFMASFKPWAQNQGLHDRSDGDLLALLKTSFDLGWKRVAVSGRHVNQRTIKGLRPETSMALTQMKGGSNEPGDTDDELVGEPAVRD